MGRTLLNWSLSLLLLLSSWGVSSSAIAAEALGDRMDNSPPAITGPAAESALDLFRDAYEHRYTWNIDFPGYQAEVSVRYEGQLYHGLVHVKPDLTTDVINIENRDVAQLVDSQLQMSITHLKRVPFAERHQQHQFERVGEDETGATEIQQLGDDSDSHYKVKDQEIKQVNRVLGDVAVKVDTLGSIRTPEGYLPTRFQVTFKDVQTGEVLEQDDVRDFYEKIGSYYLLTNREIRFGLEEGPRLKPLPDVTVRFDSVQPLPII
ncbi:DUF3386 family protein [Oculatella sp. LEGE 06141]|nr:DUF3386 family protein [Oculatella sp. LEGE 06141]